jgi:hypothetical protein
LVTPSGTSTGVYNLSFTFKQGYVTISVGGVPTQNCAYDNATNLAAVYDQYRIDKVEMQIFFSNNISNVTSPSVTLPILTIVEDYDDANSITLAKANAYNNAIHWQLGQTRGSGSIKKTVKPTVDALIYNGVTSAYARSAPIFLDCSDVGVPHYGVKVVVDPIVQTSSSTICGYLSFSFKTWMTYKCSI